MRKLLLTLTAILSFLVTVTAQSHIVTGKVTDSLGNPLPSASIRVKGAKSGTAADANGNFSISVPSGATLVFTGIGIISQEIAVGNESTVNVSLRTSGSELAGVMRRV